MDNKLQVTTNDKVHETLKNKTFSDVPLLSFLDSRAESVQALQVKWPWYGLFSMSLGVVETRAIPIAACSWSPKTGQGQLHFNPDNFPKFDLKTRAFAIAHEITHWTHRHVFSHHRGPLVNIAMDMEINSRLAVMGLIPTHPEEFITVSGVWHKYVQLEPNLKEPPEEMAWEWYWNWLLDRKKNIESKLDELLAKLGLSKGDQGEGDLLGEGVAPGLDQQITDHSQWEEMTESEKDLVKQFIGNQIEKTSQTVKPPGSIAGGLEEFLKALKPKIDWRKFIKNWAGQCGSIDIATTRSRQNKYGSFPRVVMMPRASIAIIQDTSGSVPSEELAQFWGEIESMKNKLGLEIYVLQVDAAVQSCEKFIARPNIGYKAKGRGGTDMRVGYKYIQEHLRNKVSGIICMTDGYTPFPSPKDLGGKHNLWVVTQKDMVDQVPKGIGPTIYLDIDQKV